MFEQKIFNDSLVFLAINSNDFKEDIINKILPLTLIIFILFAMFVFAYVYTTSQILSQPIKKLQKIMEQSAGEDFSIDMPTKISNDEIEILYKYYIEALEKRQDAVLQEKKLSMLQLQAQFDLLQAQVNPHFIYNVLNVISNRGMINSDEMICDICSDLAGMLRYSTNTKEKYATVNTEIEYLELYLSLLKHRYEHRLMYSIEIDNSIKNERLPKILLQQIAENSVVHGYGNSDSIIEIVVKGVLKDSGFEIIVSDNGDGITEDTINAIYKSFDDIKKKFTDNRVNVEMEIGGMGLLNTFARLYLLYNESAYIHLHSKSTGGTEVVIGVKYK